MATPRLENAFDPVTYTRIVEKAVMAKSALFNSTAIARSAEFDDLARSAGTSVIMPYIDELDGTAEVGSRDASIRGEVHALAMGDVKAQKDYLSHSWGVSKLDAQLAGVENVLRTDAERTAGFWVRNFDRLLLNKLTGVIENNIANDGGDMVKDISKDTTGAAGATNKASAEAIIDTVLTMGDSFDELGLWVFPTQVYGTLLKLDAAMFVQPSQLLPFRTYRGVPCVVTDGVAPKQGTNQKIFTSFALGAGSVLFGSANGLGGENVIVNDEHAAKNMGAKDLITRQNGLIMTIQGHTSKAPIVGANAGPEVDAYANASSWDRVYDRKFVRIAALRSNG